MNEHEIHSCEGTYESESPPSGVHAGSVRYSRLGNLRYLEVRLHTSSSRCDYNMGFCGNGVATKMKVTGEDKNGLEWTGEDIFWENSA